MGDGNARDPAAAFRRTSPIGPPTPHPADQWCCLYCGYSLVGLVPQGASAVCPECGKNNDPPSPAPLTHPGGGRLVLKCCLPTLALIAIEFVILLLPHVVPVYGERIVDLLAEYGSFFIFLIMAGLACWVWPLCALLMHDRPDGRGHLRAYLVVLLWLPLAVLLTMGFVVASVLMLMMMIGMPD